MPAYILDSAAIKKSLEITPEEAEIRSQLFTPLVRGEDGFLHTIDAPDLFNSSFTWGAQTKEKVDANSLSLLKCIHTYHTCGYHMFFKPTIAEVLAQIPQQAFVAGSERMYFEVLFDDDLIEIIDNGFYGHRTTALIYSKI